MNQFAIWLGYGFMVVAALAGVSWLFGLVFNSLMSDAVMLIDFLAFLKKRSQDDDRKRYAEDKAKRLTKE